MEVNEEGSEAAVVTVMVVGYGVAKKRQLNLFVFFADRPFLFLIRGKSTGLILFIGSIDEPK